MRRYPLDALVAVSGLSEAALARLVRLSGTTLKNARENGLREDAADRYAVRAGFHPAEVWTDWSTVEIVADDAVPHEHGTCGECGRGFIPRRADHRWCSKRCRNLASSRAWKQRNAEANRLARRAYYTEHGNYERARQRRYEAARKSACASGSPQADGDVVAA